jgi:menaquinone-dependent protoporphyrinogen oxidase
VAEEIARTLIAAGLEAEVKTPDAVGGVESYDAVVLGSAMYYGQWLPGAVDFVRRNGPAMKARPTWLFSVGPIGAPEARPVEDPAIIAELVSRTAARGHRLFTGALHRRGLRLGERVIASVVKAPEGDFRDWPAIRRWAEEIAAEVQALEAVPSGA